MNIAEMRTLRRTCCVTRLDRTRDEYMRGRLGVTNYARKMRENRLRWIGLVERINNDDIIKTIGQVRVSGKG